MQDTAKVAREPDGGKPTPPGTSCPQLLSGRCDGQAVVVFHLHSKQERLTAHQTTLQAFTI
jgi:hypothetical protein